MPISLIAVQSVNGLITRNDEPGTSFASDADLAWFKEILMGHDLVLLGGATYRAAREAIIRGAEEGTPRWVITRKPDDYVADRIPGKLEFIRLDEAALFEAIIEYGYENIALVGGPAISDWFLDRGLISEIYLTVEPVIFSSGKPLVTPARNIDLHLVSVSQLSDQTLLLHYRIRTAI
jgi:dihydrofolate reductase